MSSNEPTTSRIPEDRREKRKIQDSEAPESKRIRLEEPRDSREAEMEDDSDNDNNDLDLELDLNFDMNFDLDFDFDPKKTGPSKLKEDLEVSEDLDQTSEKKHQLARSVEESLKQERKKLLKAFEDPKFGVKEAETWEFKSEEEELELLFEAFKL